MPYLIPTSLPAHLRSPTTVGLDVFDSKIPAGSVVPRSQAALEPADALAPAGADAPFLGRAQLDAVGHGAGRRVVHVGRAAVRVVVAPAEEEEAPGRVGPRCVEGEVVLRAGDGVL